MGGLRRDGQPEGGMGERCGAGRHALADAVSRQGFDLVHRSASEGSLIPQNRVNFHWRDAAYASTCGHRQGVSNMRLLRLDVSNFSSREQHMRSLLTLIHPRNPCICSHLAITPSVAVALSERGGRSGSHSAFFRGGRSRRRRRGRVGESR